MEYVRKVAFDAFAKAGPDERKSQALIDHGVTENCTINYIQTPAGGGSPAGLHYHEVDQIFYVLSGIMNVEVEGQQYECGPGSLIIFPKGVPHRNWNDGTEPTVHLAFNTPMPDPSRPFAISV
jgi:quercetin dioxygenase-like cupin family protein